MNGVVHTKRIYPYAVGRIGTPYDIPSYIENPEGVLSEDDSYTTAFVFDPGGSEYKYLSLLFALDLPSFALLTAGRYISRGWFDDAELAPCQVRLYEFHTLEGGERTGYRIDTTNSHGTEISTVVTDFSASANERFLQRLNAERERRLNFELRFQSYIASPAPPITETKKLYISRLAVEFDYTLPEFPLQVDLRIE